MRGAIFHSNSGAGVACASCHPDGRDDGHTWRSVDLGPRRTPDQDAAIDGWLRALSAPPAATPVDPVVGRGHGGTTPGAAQIDDLTAYLETF